MLILVLCLIPSECVCFVLLRMSPLYLILNSHQHTSTTLYTHFSADRAGFVLPRDIGKDGKRSNYEPLSGNRLIALLGVMFSTSSPGCTFVTDSTTSEGLNKFLESTLGLKHYRYLRGYANVISKAEELTASGEVNAEVAIETSGI